MGQAYEVAPGQDIGTLTAENDLSEKQYYCVEVTGDNQVDVCDNVADRPIGILQNKPVAGEAATVRVQGVSKAVAGGAIAAGSTCGPDSDGQVIAVTADAKTVIGIALNGAGAAGDVFSLLVTPGCQRAS
jgi:hypothetical protein